MTVLSRADACLVVALLLAPCGLGATQAQPQQVSPPGQQPPAPGQQPPATPAATPPPPPGQPADREPPVRHARRDQRKKRQPRAAASGRSARTPRVSEAEPKREELRLGANVLGGYDDNLGAALGSGAAGLPTAMASGYNGSVDATLGYFRGNSARSIRADSTGSLQAFPGYSDRLAPGVVGSLQAETTVGRRLTVGASQRAAYEPLLNFLSTGATPPSAVGQAVPTAGLLERRSVSSSSSVSLGNAWSPHHSTALSYSYRTQQFTGGDRGDNRSQSVLVEHRSGSDRGVKAVVGYRFSGGEYAASDGARLPTREHRMEAGPEIERQLSRRRHLTLAFGAGAGYVRSVGMTGKVPYHAWIPVGSARAAVSLSPAWSLEGGYRRDFSLLQGVTDAVYSNDTAFLTTGGPVAAGTWLRVGATYGKWRTPLASGVNDTLDVYGASVQLRVALTSRIAASVNYFYYDHRYSNPGNLPSGFPAEYGRHAVRFGLAMSVPLLRTVSY